MRTGYRYGTGVVVAVALLAAWFGLRSANRTTVEPEVGPMRSDRETAEPIDPASRRTASADSPSTDGELDAVRNSGAGSVGAAEPRTERETRGVPEDSGSAQSDSRGSIPIFLDALERSSDSIVGLRGVDPHAPRKLVAWRVKGGKRAIVARGYSDRDGQLVFPELIVPRDGLEVIVTDADKAPGVPGASISRTLVGRDPHPPQAAVMEVDGPDYFVRIMPTELTGTVLLADANGDVFAEYPVASTPMPVSRIIDVELNVAPGATVVLSAHEFDDGRRSEWRTIALDAEQD